MIQSSGILFQIIWRFLTIFAETSSNGIFEFLKITKNQWLISRCRKSLKSKSVKWIISIFAAMWSPVVVERSPTGNLTNGRLITIICRGGFRVYFHICQQNKLLLLLRLLSLARQISVDWFSFHLIRHHPVKTNIFPWNMSKQDWISHIFEIFEKLTFSYFSRSGLDSCFARTSSILVFCYWLESLS